MAGEQTHTPRQDPEDGFLDFPRADPVRLNVTTHGVGDAALEEHLFRVIAELFGKEDGYCRGRGGGMHIADFTVGHLGANAIVGGGIANTFIAAAGFPVGKLSML